jgi:hypothetical protein
MSRPTSLLVWGADDPTLEGLDELSLERVVLVEAGRETTDPPVTDQLLAVLDRMDDDPGGWTLALGPDVFGWVVTGQLTDIRGWAELWDVTRLIVWAPATQDSPDRIRETGATAVEVAQRVGAIAAARTDQLRALQALTAVVDGTWTGRTA